MAFVNFSTREITAKIVYYGPGLCGKTTTLQYIFESIVPENKGQMVSLATDVDRTIYFDFLPLKLGKIQNFTVRIQLYTVPGQVRYNSTRKLVLSGTDGVVFVADLQKELMDENVKSFKNLVENLKSHGMSLGNLPHIMQYNKRDLPNLSSIEEMNTRLNRYNVPFFETCATTGYGILEGLKAISKLLMKDLNEKGVINRAKVQRVEQVVSQKVKTDTSLKPVFVNVPPAEGGGPRPAEPGGFFPESSFDVDVGETAGRGGVTEKSSERAAVPAAEEAVEKAGGARALPVEVALSNAAEEKKVETTQTYESGSLGFPPNPFQTFSYSGTFTDPILADALFAMEKDICQGNFKEAVVKARNVFIDILTDEEFFPALQDEGSKALALGISWKKYQRFVTVTKMASPSHENAMFAHHFVMDAYFSKSYF
jgi:signal recognition particle receptor subunit beta